MVNMTCDAGVLAVCVAELQKFLFPLSDSKSQISSPKLALIYKLKHNQLMSSSAEMSVALQTSGLVDNQEPVMHH